MAEWEGVSAQLVGLEAPQVKQQQGELVTVQDVLVVEGELQDILGAGQEARGPEAGRRAGTWEEPSPSAAPAPR